MIDENLDDIAKIRRYIYKYGLKNISIKEAEKEGISASKLILKYGSVANLVDRLLEHERKSFEQIFKEYDFNGMNAIDILLVVSQEISNRFHYLSPTTTVEFKKYFPRLYEKHVSKRLDFIYEKIKINIEKGIKQKVYKSDFSLDMMARLYVSKINEVHDPEIYPENADTFSVIFDRLIKNFVYNIGTDDGIKYYKQRKQLYGVLNFGR